MGACASASTKELQEEPALGDGVCSLPNVATHPSTAPSKAASSSLTAAAAACSMPRPSAQASEQQAAVVRTADSASRQGKLLAYLDKAEGSSTPEHILALLSDLQPTDGGHAESSHLTSDKFFAASCGRPHDVMLHGPPRPANDDNRKLTMRTLGLETAGPCLELDVLVKVIARMFGTKYSSIALFAESRCWLAAGVNLPVGHLQWRIAACPWDLLCPSPTTMVCENLAEDARFEHQPYTKGGLRTYVSAPLIASNGHRIGTICFLDDVVHSVDAGHCRLLNNMAEIAVREVERFAQLGRKLFEKVDSAHEAFMQSGQKYQRDMQSAHGSCLVLLDVSVPGWEILYTTPSWVDWTGISRDACVGGTLADALESALNPGMPLGWEDCLGEVAANARFMLPKLRARSGGAGAVRGSAGSEARPTHSTTAHRSSAGFGDGLFDLSFRSASHEGLDADTLPIGIPSLVPMTSSMSHIYVARLHAINASVPLAALGTAAKVNPYKVSPLVYAPQLIYGLHLHHIIGRGGYGTVYHASWHDTEVATKVQDYMLKSTSDQEEAELEVSLGQTLAHSNVVHTLAHASVKLEHHPAPPEAASLDSSACGPWLLKRAAFHDGDDEMEFDEWTSDCMLSHSRGALGTGTTMHPTGLPVHSGATDFAPSGASTDTAARQSIASRDQASGGGADLALPEAQQAAAAGGKGTGLVKEDVVVTLVGHPEGGSVPLVGPQGGEDGEAALVVTVYPQEIRTFQVLEFCDKGCLQDAIDRGWLRTSPSQLCGPDALVVLATALDIAAALTFLHGRGIVHGDLTSNNVLLRCHRKANQVDSVRTGVPLAVVKDAYGREFSAKVADFGKSRPLGAEEYIRTSSYGTITHMAPEVLLHRTLGRPADIFAFGVLLWAMWTGSHPWAGLSHQKIFDTVTANTHSLTFPDDTPPELSRLGARCLSHAAADRPPIAEVCAALEAMLLSRGASLPASPSSQAFSPLGRAAFGSGASTGLVKTVSGASSAATVHLLGGSTLSRALSTDTSSASASSAMPTVWRMGSVAEASATSQGLLPAPAATAAGAAV